MENGIAKDPRVIFLRGCERVWLQDTTEGNKLNFIWTSERQRAASPQTPTPMKTPDSAAGEETPDGV